MEEIDLPEELSWYCVYHIDFFPFLNDCSEDSYWGLPIEKVKEGYPEFDLDKYTYLFSFERKVEKLSYYVWDHKGPGIVDLGTANKWGTAVLSDETYENKIFIYRFPKVAVDNKNTTKYRDNDKWGTSILSTYNTNFIYRFPMVGIDNINVTKYAYTKYENQNRTALFGSFSLCFRIGNAAFACHTRLS